MPSAPTIIDFVTDPQLLGLKLSPAQETLLRSIYGLPLSPDQLDLWRLCSGRTKYPGRAFGEVTVCAGARSGKDSRIAGPIVCYEAVFGGHERCLSKGETGTVVLVAQDARAVGVAFGFIRGYFLESPVLASLVDGEPLTNSLRLTNGLVIQCFPCTLKSMRGFSIPVAVMDEVAYFRLEGQADSDVEIQTSIRRGMIAFPTTRLVKISTPYMKTGVLFDDFKKYFGRDSDDVLVWRAPSALMNPSLATSRLDREQRLDPERFAREYEAEFAEDLEAFLPSAWVDGAVLAGRHELPPLAGVRYLAAVDPSGGGADAFTLAIVHVEGQGAERRVVQDVMRGWARRGSESVDLAGVVKEIAEVLRRYGLSAVYGDRYAAGWVRERFRAEGVRYVEPQIKTVGVVDATERYLDKSMAYLEVEPLFAQGRIDVLDHATLARELKLLERRPRAGGKALVDHPSGGHDDHATALALATALAARHHAGAFGHAVVDSDRVIGTLRTGGQAPYAAAGGRAGQTTYLGGLLRSRR